ncbi:dof zinc finger protein DOF3.1-like [Forsythia ovata]|uniref:Dof zinc finger protein DOF3.1-like n=1 Tax=Forsythia ovata TaxID=205694 RepID=A0ABD1WCD2_9LAMI
MEALANGLEQSGEDGTLRNISVGGGSRKNTKCTPSTSSSNNNNKRPTHSSTASTAAVSLSSSSATEASASALAPNSTAAIIESLPLKAQNYGVQLIIVTN